MTAADQTPATKRCGECRLGLGVHTTTDPYCDHHQPPATDSERVELARVIREVRTEHAADGMFALDDTLTVEDIVDSVLALDAEHTRLTALLAEQAATIERLHDVGTGVIAHLYEGDCPVGPPFSPTKRDRDCPACTALGSQRTEGQG